MVAILFKIAIVARDVQCDYRPWRQKISTCVTECSVTGRDVY